MKFGETEGKTIEEAISKACEELHASPEDLDVEVLADGSSGFLGLVGGKKARIRAMLKETKDQAETTASYPATASSSPVAEIAKKALQDLLGLLEIEAGVGMREEPTCIFLNITGNSSGLLIGRKGQTLEALEYLINKIVHKRTEEKKRIVVDTENYRSRREESLVNLAHRLADKAKRLGKPVTVSPMNAHDRRTIHLALQDDKTLRTRSTGTGLYRKVIITPEKKPS